MSSTRQNHDRSAAWHHAVIGAALALAVALSMIPAPERATPATGRDQESQTASILDLARQCALQCANAIQRWISSGEITERRLFSRLYSPVPYTDPPAFTTDYDKLAERDILPIEEAALGRSADIVFVVLVDINGYLPAHNVRYSQTPTGNMERDLLDNRTKRILCDKTGLQAARSTSPYLVQTYKRDSGETIIDLSVPVYVNGKHWGAIRIDYRPTTD